MKYRSVRLLLGVYCTLATGGAVADGPARAVWAIGLPHGYIVMEHQATVINVTSDDVARGFVQIAGGSRLIVATRSQGDYALHFARRGALFRSVKIEGLGPAVELGAQGGTVVQRDMPAGKAVVAVNYRFQLAPETVPGIYAWPLEVVARHALPEGFVASGPNPGPTTLSERAAR
jgi:hypothetical protein